MDNGETEQGGKDSSRKFYLQNGSVVQTRWKLKAHFKTKKAPPTRKAIVSLAEHFLYNGTVQNQNSGNSGHRESALIPLKIGQVALRVTETVTVNSDCATVTVNLDRYLAVLKHVWRDLNAKCVDTIRLHLL